MAMNDNGRSGDEFQRLGKRELGRHAFESQMPKRVADLIAREDDSNSVSRVVPKLAELLGQDNSIAAAYLCTDAAVQVFKIPGEGACFCGYRNLQMLCLTCDHPALPKKQKLTISQLQEMIEAAWAQGFNAHGQTQTGGIKNTRKYIGSSEVEALLLSLDIACTGTAFSGQKAWAELLDAVESYFASSISGSSMSKVKRTSKAPVFLQRPKHSITIVGIERTQKGRRRLLVFDPAWRPPAVMRGEGGRGRRLGWSVLRRYRKSERSLRRFGRFEIVCLDD